jgi:hypothetical protein
MNWSSSWGRLWKALVCAVLAMALGADAVAAVQPHPPVGRLPGFPRERGMIPVLDSAAAVSARERVVNDAFSAARAEHHAIEPNPGQPACPEVFAFTQNVCYQSGPVLRKPIVHLIFWQGPPTLNVEPFPALYRSTIERYFTDVAHDASRATNVYAVDPQYGESEVPGVLPGVNGSLFDNSDVAVDSIRPFPNKCSDNTAFSKGPCLLDGDIQKEVTEVAGEITRKWTTESLQDVFLVFTPPGVGSCTAELCAYKQYCAYHSDFNGDGFTVGKQTIYANMPFAGVAGCDHGIHPNEGKDEGTDAAIDTASHELNEAITDPLGSQCKSFAKKECEPSSWTDAIGQEIGDKCLPPETTIAGQYGEPLGKTAFENGLYNQLVNGNPYWTQTEWSNEAGVSEGRCVQRFVNATFSVPPGARATVPTTFDGSASGEGATDPIVYWVWDFGDKMQVGTPEPTASHTYATSGMHEVTLTVFDKYGNSNTHTLEVQVGTPPLSPLPSLPPAPITLTKIVTVPAEPTGYTAAQLAEKLGLPRNSATLPGLGTIPLGHAECPPACSIALNLYVTVRITKHHRRMAKRVVIGTLTTTVAAKGTGTLALALNAIGRKLLTKSHKLSSQLTVIVVGQEGGSWQLTRTFTLTSASKAAKRQPSHS